MSADRHRILIVDEDRLLGEFYSCLLGLQGFIPVWASNGQQARQIVERENEPFALAVIDLHPPAEPFWELISFFRSSPMGKDMPLITITGMSLSYEELERIKEACDAVLLKGSFELAKFKDTVMQLTHVDSSI